MNLPKTFFFKLPSSWWSRRYEYKWASKFCEKGDIALDAACGVSHPLKFFLAQQGNKVHACDLDDRIMSYEKLMMELINDMGEENASKVDKKFYNEIQFDLANLLNLPYADNYFDKVYCISVLEHLSDMLNGDGLRNRLFLSKRIKNPLLRKDIFSSLFEFKRVLKPEGLLILTFDYPDINLRYVKKIIDFLGLEPVGNLDLSIPNNALDNVEKGLKCFRLVLRKKSK